MAVTRVVLLAALAGLIYFSGVLETLTFELRPLEKNLNPAPEVET
ncbi:MAG TPA: hypothetical protein VMW03_05695 [Candidatus Krumholzibacteriaceae bacterium]|nr:hypothetical protein [Candidatus Krumholzibacteriaceae bacterium]